MDINNRNVIYYFLQGIRYTPRLGEKEMRINLFGQEIKLVDIAKGIAIAVLTVAELLTLMIVEGIIFAWTWGQVAQILLNQCVDKAVEDIDLVALVESFQNPLTVREKNSCNI